MARRARTDERGEVFPVAILFGGVLLTILIGIHVLLVSLALTAVQGAADRGVSAAQQTPPGAPTCGSITTPYGSSTPTSERECSGLFAAFAAIGASISLVEHSELPVVHVDEGAGVVSVLAFGRIHTPVLGQFIVVGSACGPLDAVQGAAPTRADTTRC